MKYVYVIEQANDGSYSAYVPDLPGCTTSGESVEEIACARGFVPSTIYSHLLAAIECGKLEHARERFFTAMQENEIATAFRQVSGGTLGDISGLLGGKYEIGLLRIFRAFATRSNQGASRN